MAVGADPVPLRRGFDFRVVHKAPRRALIGIVPGTADQRGVAVAGQRDALTEVTTSDLPAGELRALLTPGGVGAGEDPGGTDEGAFSTGRRSARFRHPRRSRCSSRTVRGVGGAAGQLAPSWLQLEPERANTHAAPVSLLSSGPPIRAVSPSPETETLQPSRAPPVSPSPASSALLRPARAGEGEDPGCADAVNVARNVAGAADQCGEAASRRGRR